MLYGSEMEGGECGEEGAEENWKEERATKKRGRRKKYKENTRGNFDSQAS